MLWETLVHSFWSCVRDWSKQKPEITVFQIIWFSIDYIRSFIHPPLDNIYSFSLYASEIKLWDTLTQIYFTVFYKSGMISIIYHKYGKSFIKIISLPASYAMRIPWKKNLIYILSFSLTDFSCFFGFVMKNCVFF